ISVSAAGVTEAGSVTVTCVAPPTVGGTTWRLYRDTQDSPFMTKTEEQNRVQFTVSGRDLLQGTTHTVVQLSCEYTETGTNVSQRSSQKELKVLGKLPPANLTLSPVVLTERDSVRLSCEGPRSLSASQCYFQADRKPAAETPSDCQLSVTGAQLLQMAGGGLVGRVFRVDCQYTVDIGYRVPSPHSDNVTVTLVEKTEPTVNLSTHNGETVIRCAAPPPVTGALFYLCFSGAPENNTERRAAAGETAVTFTVPYRANTSLSYCCSYKYHGFVSNLSCCSEAPDKPSGTGVVVTAGVLTVVLLLLLTVGAVCLYRGCKKQESDRPETPQCPLAGTVTSSSNTPEDNMEYAVISDSPAACKPRSSGLTGGDQGGQDISKSQQQMIPLTATPDDDPNYATVDDLPAAPANIHTVYSLVQEP
ncbi:hypothetical protein GN956_G25690, partial [Arapaima gigas]